MASVSLTGADTIQINNRVFADLADGDCVKLNFPEDIAKAKPSKNGNIIYAFNESGKMVECEMRLLLGADDDAFLNSLLQEMKNDFSSFILMNGSFSKRVGDGKGNINTVIYQCVGGVFKKQPEAMTNTEGNTDQSVVVFNIQFGNQQRSIQ